MAQPCNRLCNRFYRQAKWEMLGLKTNKKRTGQVKKFFESQKGVVLALDNYIRGRVQHHLTDNLIMKVNVSVRLAMGTIPRSRIGQQQQQRLHWAIAEVEVGGILVSLVRGSEVIHRYMRRLPHRVGLLALRCTRLKRGRLGLATQRLGAAAHCLFVLLIKVE